MKRISKKLALLCALVIMLTALGGVAMAAGETGIVKRALVTELDVGAILYALMIDIEKAGTISIEWGTLFISNEHYDVGECAPFPNSWTSGNYRVTITDALGTFSFLIKEAVGDGYPNPNKLAPITPAADPLPDPAPNYPKARIGNVKEFVNVRLQPSSSAEILGQAYLNEVVELVRYNVGSTWCWVVYNNGNNAGWVPAKYLVAE